MWQSLHIAMDANAHLVLLRAGAYLRHSKISKNDILVDDIIQARFLVFRL